MNKDKSVFRCGAENGISFGLYLSAIFFSFVYGNASLFISTAGLVLILAIPILLFRYMRRYGNTHIETSNFSFLWMLGTMTVLFGSLICAAVTYIWLDIIMPDFIFNQAESTLAAYEQIPELKNHELTKVLRQAIENKSLPTAIEFAVQMLGSTFSIGVILSLIIAPLARPVKRFRKQ